MLADPINKIIINNNGIKAFTMKKGKLHENFRRLLDLKAKFSVCETFFHSRVKTQL